ncbi:MAG: PilN domain-containing protein [Candidatus Acidiferrales bacterium]|jgi:type IV pilus assembly protein PilN
MIRINLLGQTRPKAAKSAVPLEATMQIVFALVAIGVALTVLGVTYYQQKSELDRTNARIASLRAERASLEQIKQDVDRFESQKNVLQQRIDVIETLQKNRTGGQDLLQMVANTVVHVDNVWLTSLNRTGNSIDMQGEAASINSVANFITQLKRSGYFDNVEIKQATEDDIVPSVATYGFSMTAAISPQTAANTQPTGAPQPPPQPAKAGRS